jgi:FkbM family methyltransferase
MNDERLDLATIALDDTLGTDEGGYIPGFPHRPPGAKLIGGVWLPETEQHFVDMMLHNKKRTRVVDGKHTYQYHKLEAALRHLPADRRRVGVDIGAHVGLWSMWLVKLFGHVHAFEPVAGHADIFPWNMSADNWTLHRVALGEREGSVSLTVPPEQTGNAHVVGGGEVPMVTLDSCELERVDFLKIDVEGYELPVLRGAEATLRRCRPILVVEQKGNDAKFYGQPRDAAVAWLKTLGARDLAVISGDHIMGW